MITMRYEHDGMELEMNILGNGHTWPDLTDYWLQFLRGAGYYIIRQDFLDNLDEEIVDESDSPNL